MQSSSSMIWLLRAATLVTETLSVRSRGAGCRYVLVGFDEDGLEANDLSGGGDLSL